MDITDSALQLLLQFGEVEAVGLSGSTSRGVADELSDRDLCVFVGDRLPTAQERQRCYSDFGLPACRYLDGDLEVSRIDGLLIEGVAHDLLWMSLAQTAQSLQQLGHDFDCDEYVAGIRSVRPLHDPAGHIDRLRLQLPTYSDDRARHRVTDHLAKAHFSIYGLAWPSKAPRRADYFSYFYNLGCVFDHLVSAMLALNRQWRAHEKRILEQLGHLQLAPADVATRMQSLIRHEGENRDMGVGASNIRRLFADVAEISAGEFPGIDVPTDWD